MGYVVGFLVGVIAASLLVVLCERLGRTGPWHEERSREPKERREEVLVGYVANLLLSEELRESERARFLQWMETTNSRQHPAPLWTSMFVVHAAEDLARRPPSAVTAPPARGATTKAA